MGALGGDMILGGKRWRGILPVDLVAILQILNHPPVVFSISDGERE